MIPGDKSNINTDITLRARPVKSSKSLTHVRAEKRTPPVFEITPPNPADLAVSLMGFGVL